MADFNAGSIVGSLDLNKDAYTAGLEEAKRQAKEFADGSYTANVNVDVDDADALRKMDDVEAKADELDGKTINIDTKESQSQLGDLEQSAEKARGSSGGAGGEGGHGMLGLIGAALGVAPALLPAAAGIVGFGGAAVAGFAQAGIGLGAFALVAKSDFKDMQTATQAVTKAQQELTAATTDKERAKAIADLAAAEKGLSGPMKETATAYSGLQKTIANIKSDTASSVYGVLTSVFDQASKIIPKFEPLINTVATGLKGAVGQIGDALQGPGFQKFLDLLNKDAGPDIKHFTDILINVGSGLGSLIEAINPLTQELFGGIDKLSGVFSNWAASMANGGIQPFLDYIHKYGPEFVGILGNVAKTLGDVVKALIPFTGPALDFLSSLSAILDPLVNTLLPPLEGLLEDVLTALTPLIGLFKDFATTVGPPVVTFFDKIVKAVTPLIAQLKTYLAPVFKDLAKLIGDVSDHLQPLLDWLSKSSIVKIFAQALDDVVTGLQWMVDHIPFLVPALAILTAAWIAFDVAADANPIALVVLGIAALIAGIVELVKHWDDVSKFFTDLWNTITGFFSNIYTDVTTWASKIWTDVTGFFKDMYNDVTSWVKSMWTDVSGFFKSMWNDITGFVKDIYNDVITWFKNTYTDITKWAKSIWTDVSGFFKNMWNDITGFVKDIYNGVTTWFASMWKTVTGGVSTAVNAIITFFKNLPGNLVSAAEKGVQNLLNLGGWLIGKVIDGLNDAWHTITSWFGSIASKIWSFVSGLAKDAWNGAANIGHQLLTWVVNGLMDEVNGIGKIFKWFGNLATTVWNWVKGVASSIGTGFYNFGVWIVQQIKDGLDWAVANLLLPDLSGAVNKIGGLLGLNGAGQINFGGIPGSAGGGDLKMGYNWINEKGPELLYNTGSSVHVLTHGTSQSMAQYINPQPQAQTVVVASSTNDDVVSRLDVLIGAIRKLPKQTGEHVGAQVASKFGLASQKMQNATTLRTRMVGG